MSGAAAKWWMQTTNQQRREWTLEIRAHADSLAPCFADADRPVAIDVEWKEAGAITIEPADAAKCVLERARTWDPPPFGRHACVTCPFEAHPDDGGVRMFGPVPGDPHDSCSWITAAGCR